MQQDTFLGYIETPISQNLYIYCYNSPLNYIDPSGNRVNTSYGRDRAASYIKSYDQQLENLRDEYDVSFGYNKLAILQDMEEVYEKRQSEVCWLKDTGIDIEEEYGLKPDYDLPEETINEILFPLESMDRAILYHALGDIMLKVEKGSNIYNAIYRTYKLLIHGIEDNSLQTDTHISLNFIPRAARDPEVDAQLMSILFDVVGLAGPVGGIISTLYSFIEAMTPEEKAEVIGNTIIDEQANKVFEEVFYEGIKNSMVIADTAARELAGTIVDKINVAGSIAEIVQKVINFKPSTNPNLLLTVNIQSYNTPYPYVYEYEVTPDLEIVMAKETFYGSSQHGYHRDPKTSYGINISYLNGPFLTYPSRGSVNLGDPGKFITDSYDPSFSLPSLPSVPSASTSSIGSVGPARIL